MDGAKSSPVQSGRGERRNVLRTRPTCMGGGEIFWLGTHFVRKQHRIEVPWDTHTMGHKRLERTNQIDA